MHAEGNCSLRIECINHNRVKANKVSVCEYSVAIVPPVGEREDQVTAVPLTFHNQ